MLRRAIIMSTVLVTSEASANGPEDLFGVSARTNGMGGAATATSSDGFAAYHNPAGLARCADSQISVDARHLRYGFDVDRTGADAPAEGIRDLDSDTRFAFSGCIRLPRNFALGISSGIGLENPSTLKLDTASRQPNFVLYGDSLEYLSINVAVAYRPIRQLALGVGASVLADSDLTMNAYVPVGQSDAFGNYENLDLDISWGMTPRAAPYFGVTVEPLERLRISVAYRGELAHRLDLPMSILTVFLSYPARIPMHLEVDTWYSPRALSVGAAFDATPNLMVTGDFTWADYGALANSSYPYLFVGDLEGTMGSLFDLVGRPNPDPPGFKGVFTGRFGVEGRLLDGKLALRGGYAVRSSALPDPGTRNTTLLDGTIHTLTAGAGYAFGRGWDASHVDEDEAAEPIYYEDDVARTNLSYRVDGYARLSMMPERSDGIRDIRWGGTLFDAGATFSLGWH